MTFQPYPTRSGFISLAVTFISAAVAIYLINILPQQSDPPTAFKLFLGLILALGITGGAICWAIVAFRLRYFLNRNGLAIQWGLARQLIPFETIQNVIPGKELPPSLRFRGLNILGLRLGWGESTDHGPLKFHSTAAVVDSLLVITPDRAYVISPRQPDNFLKAWQVRRPLGPTQDWPTGVQRSWPLKIPMLSDPLTWWLWGLAASICLALFGYLSLTFPELPSSLPIHFNALGIADHIVDKSTFLLLPAIGAIVLVLNAILGSLVYGKEKMAAYLLWGSTVVVQVCLWAAALTIIA